MEQKQWIWSLYVLLLLVGVVTVFMLSLGMGEIPIRIGDLPHILSEKDSVEYGVLAYIRIPRTLLGLTIGGSLSLAGTILQGIYRNPLVEPYTLGISGGASLGITFAIVAGIHLINILFLPLAGFIGAFHLPRVYPQPWKRRTQHQSDVAYRCHDQFHRLLINDVPYVHHVHRQCSRYYFLDDGITQRTEQYPDHSNGHTVAILPDPLLSVRDASQCTAPG